MRISLSNRGDTIVEVLIAITVVSLVLAGAYVSSNQSLKSTRQAQEHTEALKLAESQLELLRSASANPGGGSTIFNIANYFCMKSAVSSGIYEAMLAAAPYRAIDSTGTNFTFPTLNNASNDDFTKYVTGANSCKATNGGVTYYQAIDRTGTSARGIYTFQIHIRWVSIQANEHDEVTLMYRLDQ